MYVEGVRVEDKEEGWMVGHFFLLFIWTVATQGLFLVFNISIKVASAFLIEINVWVSLCSQG